MSLCLPHGQMNAAFVRAAHEAVLRLVDGIEGGQQNTERTRRTTWEFGYQFHRLKFGGRQQQKFPPIIRDVLSAALEVAKRASPHTLPAMADFNNCIISLYKEGDRLEPHIDVHAGRPMAFRQRKTGGFYFGENILCVVLEADETGRLVLLPPRGGSEAAPLNAMLLHEKDGSVFVLHGDARNLWFHEVSPVKRQRLSLTFRTTHFVA